jgi:hypothetical protein
LISPRILLYKTIKIVCLHNKKTMEIQGNIIQILPLQSGTGRNGEWKKQEFILETTDKFPKKICIAIWGDKIQESILQPGNKVTVQFDIESREYNGRWYTEAKAWKIESTATSTQTPAPVSSQTDIPLPDTSDFLMPEQSGDDLPF